MSSDVSTGQEGTREEKGVMRQPDELKARWLEPPPHGFGRRLWPRRGINEAEPPALAG
jgi:hypothetical protein